MESEKITMKCFGLSVCLCIMVQSCGISIVFGYTLHCVRSILPTVLLTMQQLLIFLLMALNKCCFLSSEERVGVNCIHNTKVFYLCGLSTDKQLLRAKLLQLPTCPVPWYRFTTYCLIVTNQTISSKRVCVCMPASQIFV